MHLELIHIQTDAKQKELLAHGTVQFPLQINDDHLDRYYERYIRCHWHEDLEIPVVMQGSVCCQLKDKSWELHTGEGIVINSKVPHSILPLGEEAPILLTTIFHPSLLYGTPESAIYQNLIKPYMNTSDLMGLVLSPEDAVCMQEINQLYRATPFGYELQIKALLCSLFFTLLSGRQEKLAEARPVDERDLTRLQLLLDNIHRNYATPPSLSQLAASVSLSRAECCRFFKRMTGKTVSEYLEDYRVTQGILLLQDSQYSITEAAYRVGFNNPGRFSAAFAKRMHCTPRQYRQRIQA